MITIKVMLDDRRKRLSNLYYVKARVTFNRTSRYYVVYEKRKLTPKEFDDILNSRKRSKEESTIYKEIQQEIQKPEIRIEQLQKFEFRKLENLL